MRSLYLGRVLNVPNVLEKAVLMAVQTEIGSGAIDASWLSRWGITWSYHCSLELLNGCLQNGPSVD
eukprot:2139216-Ditylum_brightwellii.AAC.2